MEEDFFARLREAKLRGSKRKKFRRPTKRYILNRYLYGLMFVEDITVSEMAELTGMTRSTVGKWIFEGRIPRNEETIDLVCRILNAPKYIVFNEMDIEKRRHLRY